jgi:hypothetical protein
MMICFPPHGARTNLTESGSFPSNSFRAYRMPATVAVGQKRLNPFRFFSVPHDRYGRQPHPLACVQVPGPMPATGAVAIGDFWVYAG